MAEQALLLNTSEYFKSSEFSDVTIVLVDDPAAESHVNGAAGKRRKLDDGTAAPADAASTQNVVRLPGHKFLLCACSSVCKTQISRWTESSPHELELRVPIGQLDIGELMIKCMYEPNPDLSNCSQQQLLQLLMLSDQHDVQKAVYAASRTLSRIPTKDFEWDTVQAVYSLPPACPDMQAYKPLFAAIAARLQEEIGDLDKCLQSPLLLPQLTALPYLGILQLLKDDRTHVHSENTAVLVIRLWYKAQERANLQVRRMQQQQLREQRMQHSQGQQQEGGQAGQAVSAHAPAIGGSTEQQQQLPASTHEQQVLAAGAGSSPIQHQQSQQQQLHMQEQQQDPAGREGNRLPATSAVGSPAATGTADAAAEAHQQQTQQQQQTAEYPVLRPAAPAAGPSAAVANPSTSAEVAEDREYPPQQQIEQLVHLIRVQYCTQPYVATTMFGYSRFAKCFTESERMLACIYSGEGNTNSQQSNLLRKFGHKYPAWKAAKRPTSAIDKLSLEIPVSLERVQQLAEKCLGERKKASIRLAGGRFQGRQIVVELQAQYQDTAQPHPGCSIHICAGLEGMPEGSLAGGALQIQVIPAPLNHHEELVDDLQYNFRVSLRKRASLVSRDCLAVGLVTDWLATERNLRLKALVHPDGCMHIGTIFREPFL